MSAETVAVLQPIENLLRYKWTVRNYSEYNLVGQQLTSPAFTCAYPGSSGELRWRLTLYPSGSQWTYKNYLSIFLEYLGDAELTARVTLSILDLQQSNALFERSIERVTFRQGSAACGDHKFISRSYFQDLLQDHSIAILCTIALPEVQAQKHSKAEVEQVDRFEHLLDTGKFSDVTLAVGDKKFRLHKVILTSCSPVFRAMFEQHTKESQTNVVHVRDVRAEVMREMVRFMYTNKVNAIDDLAVELLVAADMYDIADLKLHCEKALCMRVGIESALQLLTLADTYNADILRSSAIEFIIRNLQDFLCQPQFKILDSSLVNEILAAIAKKTILC